MPALKARKPAPAKKTDDTPSAETAPASDEKSRVHDVLDRLGGAVLPLKAAQRTAFARRFSGAACERIGSRTKSEGVLKDALKWSSVMAKALKKHPIALRRYGSARFVYLLECIGALEDARSAQQATGSAPNLAKARVERARKTALAAREELLETLETLAEGDPDAEELLTASTGKTDTLDGIAASLRALATIARGWLDRKDEESHELVSSVSLTAEEVKAAEDAAIALDAASADKTIEGDVVVRDLPDVNRAEGRVLLEMRAAMRIFGKANKRDARVPKLVPGKATRDVLAPRLGRKDDKAKSDVPVEAPAAGDA